MPICLSNIPYALNLNLLAALENCNDCPVMNISILIEQRGLLITFLKAEIILGMYKLSLDTEVPSSREVVLYSD